jgi:aquaporin Z
MWNKAIAEAMGILFLVLIGTGAVVFGESMLSIALAFGLIVIAMAYSIGTISGAHMYPAVSLAMFLNGRMNFKGFMSVHN